jgi:hypothetical protein
MLKKIGRIGVKAALVALSLVVLLWLLLFYTEVGMAKEIGIQEPGLLSYDYSEVPQEIIDGAVDLAGEMVGKSREKIQSYADQLMAMYMEARDSDIVIVFNSGGWGWNLTRETPGWASILEGIRSELDKLGYRSVILNYRRTSSGIRGCVREFVEAAARYPNKAEDLAKRLEFLTDHLPDAKIIIAGESTGTVISDKTMLLLQNNPQVYSIQTGTPFWYKPNLTNRTLLMNSNGKTVDTFSYGNIPLMIWTSIKSWLGLSSPEDEPGDILSWLKAPGHDYSWQYPGVYTEVVRFLQEHIGPKE